MSVGASGIAGSQIFYIQAAFETVTIQMEVKNNPLFGEDILAGGIVQGFQLFFGSGFCHEAAPFKWILNIILA